MIVHIGEGPESGQMWTQGQTKQDDYPEEAWKDCPHTSDLNHPQGLRLSLSLPPLIHPCLPNPGPPALSLHISSLLIHTLFASLLSVSAIFFFFPEALGLGIYSKPAGPRGPVVRVQHSTPTANNITSRPLEWLWLLFKNKKKRKKKENYKLVRMWRNCALQ